MPYDNVRTASAMSKCIFNQSNSFVADPAYVTQWTYGGNNKQ